MLADNVITSSDYSISILKLCRSSLTEVRKVVHESDELHVVSITIKDVEIRVKVGKEEGSNIKTNGGNAQGDSPSAILFIFIHS